MGLGPPERLTVLVGMALVALVMGLPLDTYVSWMITSCWPAILGSCTPYLGHTLSVVGTAVALLAAVVWLLGVDLGWVLAYTVTNHRWVLACILMPISVVFDGFMNLRVKLVFMLGSAPDQHEKRVAEVSRQVLDWRETGAPQGQKMCTARPGWLTMSLRVGKYKATHRNIKVELRDVLAVDTTQRTVRVEPMVTMGQISATLEPLGWTLAVLPELDDLTVGGLICGCGVESSSHQYGMFQETLVSCEMVMANGEVITCSKDVEPELFRAIPWSHGTLGFLVSAEIAIVPAAPWIRLEYMPCHSKADYLQLFERASFDEKADFVEGLVYSKDTAVIMVGSMVNEVPPEHKHLINRIGRWFKPWWYTHVETKLSASDDRGCPAYRKGVQYEYIPLRDWYHRHTKALFWELQDIIPFGNHVVFRWLFGWAVPPKIALIKLTQTEELRQLYENYHVVQDMLVPLTSLGDAIDCMHAQFEVYPLWLCPMRVEDHGEYFIQPSKPAMYVDVGAYGNPATWPKPPHPSPAVQCVREVEEFVRDNGGFQMLYADSYHSREEFRKMFNHTIYDKLRRRFECDKAFPEVYDKVCKAARH